MAITSMFPTWPGCAPWQPDREPSPHSFSHDRKSGKSCDGSRYPCRFVRGMKTVVLFERGKCWISGWLAGRLRPLPAVAAQKNEWCERQLTHQNQVVQFGDSLSSHPQEDDFSLTAEGICFQLVAGHYDLSGIRKLQLTGGRNIAPLKISYATLPASYRTSGDRPGLAIAVRCNRAELPLPTRAGRVEPGTRAPGSVERDQGFRRS